MRLVKMAVCIATLVSVTGCATLDTFIEDYRIDELVGATANEYVKQKYRTDLPPSSYGSSATTDNPGQKYNRRYTKPNETNLTIKPDNEWVLCDWANSDGTWPANCKCHKYNNCPEVSSNF